MTKREKIIVGLMLAVVGWGGYSVFFDASGPKSKGASIEGPGTTLNDFVAEIGKSLSGMDLSGPGADVMRQAETAWQRDPFLETELTVAGSGGTDTEAPLDLGSTYAYTGYLKMGQRDMAIINGMEYEPGEVLEPVGHVVKAITPTHVVLAVAGGEKDQVLLLTETE